MSGLEIRNSSILAHGFITVDKSRYNTIYKSLIMDLVLPILQKLMGDSYSTFTQLPNHAPHRL